MGSEKTLDFASIVTIVTVLIIMLIVVSMILGPTPEPHHAITGCLMGLGSQPTAEAKFAQCLTQQAAMTPTPWWQFWGH